MRFKKILLRPYVLASIIFLFSIILRLTILDKIPTGLTNDNVIFALNAKTIFHTGHDVSGTWQPFSFTTLPDEPAQSEIAYTFLAPTIGPLDSPLLAAHLLNALISSLLPVIVFFIVLKLLGKPQAVLSGLVMAFNPWGIFFGRSLYEAGLAVFFYTLSFLCLIYLKSWKKLITLIPLALGFYIYMAYKVTLIPYVVIISFFTWRELDRKKNSKVYLTIIAVCVTLFALFIFNLRTQNTADRLNEASFVSMAKIEAMVNSERQSTIENPFTNIASNKMTASVKEIAGKYIGAFSPQHLFVTTEQTQRFSIYNHGYFYYLDFVFLLLGFCFLFTKKTRVWLLLTAVILVSPLPSVVSTVENSYAMRSSLYIPFLCIFIGAGIYYFLKLFKKKYQIAASAILALLYLILVANFMYTYLFIQPVENSEGQAFSSRVLSSYLTRAEAKNFPVIVAGRTPRDHFKYFAYFSGALDSNSLEDIQKAFAKKNYNYHNLEFVTCDQLKKPEKNKTYILRQGECPKLKLPGRAITIAQLSDSGSVFNIYQDRVCTEYKLGRFIGKIKLSDLDVEKLNEEKFCKTYLVDFN